MIRRCARTLALAGTVALFAGPLFAGEEHTVNLSGSAFLPSNLAIAAGDSVRWVNDGGANSVVADDGSFDSGPPSTDTWEFSVVFHFGGTWTYHNGNDLGMTGTITVGGIFGDGFDDGTTDAWATHEPSVPNCNCYFSSDCVAGSFCDYGPGGFSTEDICLWRETKPDGVPGAGCDAPYVGEWIPDICDGTCTGSSAGSALGWEDPTLIAQGVRLWAEAMLRPAGDGGGAMDLGWAERAEALPFKGPGSATLVGRQTADLLVQAADPAFYKYFCHYEAYPHDPDPALFVDLSPCAVTTARSAIDALVAELTEPGTGAVHLAGLSAACPRWADGLKMPCRPGRSSTACLSDRIRDFAVFLTTPRADPGLAFGALLWPEAPAR